MKNLELNNHQTTVTEPVTGERTAVMPIDDIVIGDRFRKDVGDLTALIASIAEVGLLHPPVITPEKTLICGYRRMQACKSQGWTEISVRIMDIRNALAAEHDENVLRLDFTPSEKVAITEAIREHVEAEATTRRLENLKHVGDSVERAICPDDKANGRTDEILAKAVGTSRKTLVKAREVVKAAQENPDNRDLVENMDATGKVDGPYQEMKRRQKETESRENDVIVPGGNVEVLNFDPVDWMIWHEQEFDCLITQAPVHATKDFREYTKEWLSAAVDCLKEEGIGFVICKPSRVFDVEDVLSEIGYNVQSVTAWHRQAATRKSPEGIYSVRYDLILQFGSEKLHSLVGLGDAWETKDALRARDDIPTAVMERLVIAGCNPGGRVLNPFACTGNTGLACKKHGRNCTLLEQDPDALRIMNREGMPLSAIAQECTLALEKKQSGGSKEMVWLPDSTDIYALERWLEANYPEIEFDFLNVETVDDIAFIVELMNDALADPTVESINSVATDVIDFKLTQEEIQRRREEDEAFSRE